jgi:hypothetical protein
MHNSAALIHAKLTQSALCLRLFENKAIVSARTTLLYQVVREYWPEFQAELASQA